MKIHRRTTLAILAGTLAIGAMGGSPASAAASTCEVSIGLPGGSRVWAAITGAYPMPACRSSVRLMRREGLSAHTYMGVAGSARLNRSLFLCRRRFPAFSVILRGNRYASTVRIFARAFCGRAI